MSYGGKIEGSRMVPFVCVIDVLKFSHVVLCVCVCLQCGSQMVARFKGLLVLVFCEG